MQPGLTQSDNTDVELYLSADTTVRADPRTVASEDAFVAGGSVWLPSGQCTSLSLSGRAYPPSPSTQGGDPSYYLGAVVDPRNNRPELLEDNNATLGNAIVIR